MFDTSRECYKNGQHKSTYSCITTFMVCIRSQSISRSISSYVSVDIKWYINSNGKSMTSGGETSNITVCQDKCARAEWHEDKTKTYNQNTIQCDNVEIEKYTKLGLNDKRSAVKP